MEKHLRSEIKNDSTDSGESLTGTEERMLLRKIDLCLLPLLTLSYMLQFLDKQTLNFASVMGMIHDLDLRGSQYSWSSSVFYIGYLAFSYPASFLMVRFPIGKYLGCTCVAWAICLACHATTTNFTGLMIVRFFLGAAEASISPGFSLITGYVIQLMCQTQPNKLVECGTNEKSSLLDMASGSSATH